MTANSVRELMRIADPLPPELAVVDNDEIDRELAVLVTRVDDSPQDIGVFRILDRPASRRRRVLAVAAAVAVMVGAVGAAVALDRSNDDPAISGGSGVTAPPDILGATVPIENRRELAVVVELAGPVPCAIDDAHVRAVSQGAHSVAIAVSGFTLSRRPINCEIGRGDTLDLRLAAPLGGRQLIDAATGQPVPVIDGRIVPTPTYLPPGYQALPDGADEYPSAGGGLRVPMAARGYDKDSGVTGTSGIDVYAARSQVARGPGWTVDPGVYSVDGHRATLTDAAHLRCLTWTVRASLAVQVCSDVSWSPINGKNQGPLLSAAELVRIARDLR